MGWRKASPLGRGGGAADGEEKPFPLGEVAAQPTERDTERVIESPFHHPLTTLSPDFVGSSPGGRALV